MYKVLIIQYPTFLIGGDIRIPRRPVSLRSRESQPFFSFLSIYYYEIYYHRDSI